MMALQMDLEVGDQVFREHLRIPGLPLAYALQLRRALEPNYPMACPGHPGPVDAVMEEHRAANPKAAPAPIPALSDIPIIRTSNHRARGVPV